jgi:hypothetical protein
MEGINSKKIQGRQMIEHIEPGILPPNKKACIALTSWKKRINTVGLTIFNLFDTCGPDYHIVLTLAEEEFPRKERELPRDLLAMQRAGVFEILWVKKNTKSLKKICYAMARYNTVPIISADDDCIYTSNYAEVLYNAWRIHRKAISSYNVAHHYGIPFQHGPSTIYPPGIFGVKCLELLVNPQVININHDDVLYGLIAWYNHIPIIDINKPVPYIFHDTIDALSRTRKVKCHEAIRRLMKLLRR